MGTHLAVKQGCAFLQRGNAQLREHCLALQRWAQTFLWPVLCHCGLSHVATSCPFCSADPQRLAVQHFTLQRSADCSHLPCFICQSCVGFISILPSCFSPQPFHSSSLLLWKQIYSRCLLNWPELLVPSTFLTNPFQMSRNFYV